MTVTSKCHVTSRDMSRSQSHDCHLTITSPHLTKSFLALVFGVFIKIQIQVTYCDARVASFGLGAAR